MNSILLDEHHKNNDIINYIKNFIIKNKNDSEFNDTDSINGFK